MRMAIDTRRLTVSSPPGVCDARMRVEHLGQVWLGLRNELLELGDLADLLESENLIVLITVDAQTCRIIASIFQTRQT